MQNGIDIINGELSFFVYYSNDTLDDAAHTAGVVLKGEESLYPKNASTMSFQ